MNILITGACGYIGSQLVQKLQKMNFDLKWNIIATDIREKANFDIDSGTEYIKMDVRSSDVVDTIIKVKEIHTVVHLATIVTPSKKSNREFEYSVDVGGTENVLNACVKNKVKRIVITSSGAAYGYHRDNPHWLKEEDPIRGNEEFAYSYHKRLVEELLIKFRVEHPQLEQVVFRIGTILGENVNNQITNLFQKKIVLGIAGSDSPFVFIWDQDVVTCLVQGITRKKTGIYNVAGVGAVTIDDLGMLMNKKVIRIPSSIVKTALFVFKRLRLTQYGEEQVNFLQYRPVLDNSKLKNEFGFTPSYTSRETFEKYISGDW